MIKHQIFANKHLLIRENLFACLFSVHNTISLSRHEQTCLIRLSFGSMLGEDGRDPLIGKVSLDT